MPADVVVALLDLHDDAKEVMVQEVLVVLVDKDEAGLDRWEEKPKLFTGLGIVSAEV